MTCVADYAEGDGDRINSAVQNPKVKKLGEMIQRYRDEIEETGGWLHIFIEDTNCSDTDIAFCKGCLHGSGNNDSLGMDILRLADTMTELERAVAVEWFDGDRFIRGRDLVAQFND